MERLLGCKVKVATHPRSGEDGNPGGDEDHLSSHLQHLINTPGFSGSAGKVGRGFFPLSRCSRIGVCAATGHSLGLSSVGQVAIRRLLS